MKGMKTVESSELRAESRPAPVGAAFPISHLSSLTSQPRPARRRAFTLIEVVVAVGITALIAGFAVAILTNVSGFWSRTSGRLSAEAQARLVLDQLALDLQGALCRDDGNAWLAATIPANTTNAGTLWDTRNTTTNALKPANAAGSLQGSATTPAIAEARFGIAGTWLRFFTTKRGTSAAAASLSAPVAVAYQIVRRATTATAANLDRRYLLHRTEVTPANTLGAGYDLAAAAWNPTQNNPAATFGSVREIRYPTLSSVLAENVVDFGVRLYTTVPNATTGVPEPVRIFPAGNADLAHLATLPPRTPDAGGGYGATFPDTAEVMVRILTDEGARLIAGYEANPQRVTLPAGRNPQQYWWELAVANSQVFTRRIAIAAKPF